MSSSLIERFGNYQNYMNRSKGTIEQYRLDLTMFVKYLFASRKGLPTKGDAFDKMDVSTIDDEFILSATPDEILSFLMFVTNGRENSATTRARKLCSIRTFYKYTVNTLHLLEVNPAANIEAPAVKKQLPKYLTVDESIALLDAVKEYAGESERERDYAIITLFLNCGMRLSELCGISIGDLEPHLESLLVTGKGSKQRIIYLNDACKSSLTAYLNVRIKSPNVKDRNALFLSNRGNRISKKTVQALVYKYLRAAGLEYKHFSTHKLRHTAATLMYQSGNVDVRVLKDILGHEQLNTTQIYTHISDQQMKNAMDQNPLAKKK